MNIVVLVNPLQEVNEYWEAVITNMSEDDKAGIEFALQLKEKNGGTVTVVAIGTEAADTALREAFAMGVDHAAQMTDEDPSTDAAAKITAALQKVSGDVYVSGRQDDVMDQVVKSLNIPKVQCTDVESFSSQQPSLVTVTAASFNPRHMSIGGVYAAYKREIKVIPSLVTIG